jgi:hypothetical protein
MSDTTYRRLGAILMLASAVVMLALAVAAVGWLT